MCRNILILLVCLTIPKVLQCSFQHLIAKYNISTDIVLALKENSVYYRSQKPHRSSKLCFDPSDKLRIGILGGSITLGARSSRPYAALLENSLNQHRQEYHDIPEVTVINGAVPATGALVANACLEKLLGDVDVIIVEFSINELEHNALHALYQHILKIPTVQIVIAFDVFSDLTGGPRGNAHPPQIEVTPATLVAMQHDVPVVSMRTAVLPDIYDKHYPFLSTVIFDCAEVKDEFLRSCKQHMNIIGHELAAALLDAYLLNQILSADSAECSQQGGNIPAKGDISFCYSNWMPRVPGIIVNVPTLTSLAVNYHISPMWTEEPKGSGFVYLATTKHTPDVIGMPIILHFTIDRQCTLLLTSLVCVHRPYCQLGALDIQFDNEPYVHYTEAPYKVFLMAQQGVVYNRTVTAGKHSLSVAAARISASGYYGVKLIGLLCLI